MFKHIHHRTWFPFVVIGLSVFLLVFIAWAYNARQNSSNMSSFNTPAVTVDQYQREVLVVVEDFWNQYQNQEDDAARLIFVSDIEQKLLALRVPAESRSVHFELVSSLELIRQGLVGNSEKMTAGLTRLQNSYSENSWLSVN